MFEFIKKFQKTKKTEFALTTLDNECIPYACHYDDNTLLTKNGELMQVIRIEGFPDSILGANAAFAQKDFDIRAIIRQAIIDHASDRKIAIWFHTVRKKRNLDSISYFPWTFARDTHEGWATKNYWRSKFVNELYITLLYEGEGSNNQQNIVLSFIPKALKQHHLNLLAQNASKLDNIVTNILNTLAPFGGTRLKVEHDRLGAHSGILEFLTKIVCLKNKRVPLPVQDIGSIFNKTKIAFGGNTLEIIDEKDKHFAAVFSIKEYHEIPSQALDGLLRISSEYVITQTLNFVDTKEATKDLEHLNYLLTTVSKDEDLKHACGLASTMESDQGKPTDFCTQQMTMMIIGESLPELQTSVTSAVNAMHHLGIVVIREDLHIALCYWSQLPGNFSFFRRKSYTDTAKTASFASLYNTPSGNITNIWGKALTLFRRHNAAPHFFNLHVETNGNTIIVGPPDSNKGLLVNFLLSESTKYEPNVLYIDQLPTSRVIVKALGGRHELIKLNGSKPAIALNPFIMDNTPENKLFLQRWLLLLLYPDGVYTEATKTKILNIINDLLDNLPVGSRKISSILNIIDDEDIKKRLTLWCKPSKFGLLFDNDRDELGSGAKMLGLNIAEILVSENTVAMPALVSYCLYRYTQILDNSPGIIILHDANTLIQNKIFAEILPALLDQLTAKNALMIMVCNSKNHIQANISAIQDKIATYLFLPELNPKIYQDAFKLTAEEVDAIKKMKALYRHFMIKQKGENMVAELNLDGLDYVIKTLSGDKEAIEAMDKAISKTGDNPNRWIVPFYQKLLPDESL